MRPATSRRQVADAKADALAAGAKESRVAHEVEAASPEVKDAASTETKAAATDENESAAIKSGKPSEAPRMSDAHGGTAMHDIAESENAAKRAAGSREEIAAGEARVQAPEQLRSHVEGATGVERSSGYAKFEAKVKEVQARAAAPVTKVNTQRVDGIFVVDSKYSARTFEAADGKLTEITVNVHMRPGEAVSDVEMQVMREHASNGVDRFYNWKAREAALPVAGWQQPAYRRELRRGPRSGRCRDRHRVPIQPDDRCP